MKIDNVDFKIINLLSIDGRMSLSEIGKTIGLSHVAVRSRLKKLRDNGIIKINTTISTEKLKFLNIILCLEVIDINKYIKDFKHCFRIQDMIRTSGKYNLIVSFFAEDMDTLNSVLYNCKFTTDKNIKNSSVNISSDSYIKLNPKMLKNKKTCSQKCSECEEFKKNKCVGCALSDKYKSKLKIISQKF